METSKLKKVEPIPFGRINLNNEDDDTNNNDNNLYLDSNRDERHQKESWCVNCSITDPIIISGDNTGKYTLWNIRFKLSNGGIINIKKRYNDFVKLYQQLHKKYDGDKIVLNKLPGKSPLFENRFSGEFLERRRNGLEFWLNSVILDRELCFTREVRDFILK